MVGIIRKPSEIEAKYLQIPEVIYHYTSPDGVINIFDKQQLWFSRFDCLNDASEGNCVREVYDKAIRILSGEGVIKQEFLLGIASASPNYIRFIKLFGKPVKKLESGACLVDGAMVTTKPYLCSFSTEKDSLPMWNYYAKGDQYEGYNIGFRYEEIVNRNDNISAVRVIYNEKDQVDIMIKNIKDVYEDYTVYNHNINMCVETLSSVLSTRSIQFKNKAFSHENEVRMVYWEPEFNDNNEYEREEVNFRHKKGIIIPYLKIGFEKTDVCSAMIGPLIQGNIANSTLIELLLNKGYGNVKTYKSVMPIRY